MTEPKKPDTIIKTGKIQGETKQHSETVPLLSSFELAVDDITLPRFDPKNLHGDWEFAGWGTFNIQEEGFPGPKTGDLINPKHNKLGQILATAISGNDITSSCLYVAGLSITFGGKFAPLSLFLVVIVLYLFRNVYSEVGSALPLNGGAYNVLLNTTTKFVASLAATLTMLSYVATAVVSASEAMDYLHDMVSQVDPMWATIVLLGFFALLNILGISESAVVALVLFVIHLLSLMVLIVFGVIWGFQNNWAILIANWNLPPIHSVPLDVFYGFCSGLLGVSGFETSANFIEEQAPGVFPKTLRNMWVCVAFFNPMISFLALALLPMVDIFNNQRTLLSKMGRVACGGNDWLSMLISVDATLVLSGAVLTSYVGITGLVHRMALDRLLPEFLLQKNPCRKTNHWIIILFFLITSSLYLVVQGNVQTLSGVYTVAFLSVMSLFAIGNMLLKYKRSQLPREIKTRWIFVLLALFSVVIALMGNIVLQVQVLQYFSIYFLATMLIVMTMIARVSLLRIILFFLTKVKQCGPVTNKLKLWAQSIRNRELIFYTRKGDLHVLNKALMYIRENESSNRLTVVHAYSDDSQIPQKLQKNVEFLDRLYPKIRINLMLIKSPFNPALIDSISNALHVPKNYMFMACPNSKFLHNIGDFGGVRLITH